MKKKRKMLLSLRYREKEGGRDGDVGVVCGGKEDGLLRASHVEELGLATDNSLAQAEIEWYAYF